MGQHVSRPVGDGVRFAKGQGWAWRWRRRCAGEHGPPGGAPGLEFDALAKDLARGVSRRQILRRLAGTLVAGLSAELFGRLTLEPTPAAAALAPTPCSSGGSAACLDRAQTVLASALAGCFPDTQDQTSLTFYLALDQCLGLSGAGYEREQGQCLNAGCPAGTECSGGLCCPGGQVGCGAVCCAAGQSCTNNGQCRGTSSGGGGTGCTTGLTACGSSCVNLQNDPQNCGRCGHACLAGQSCVSGGCALICADGLTACGEGCVNLQSDVDNCGACGNVCASLHRGPLGSTGPTDALCVHGACQICPANQVACSGACVDLQSDLHNCGSCGHACGANEACCSGACTDITTTSNCGACGHACPLTVTCVAGHGCFSNALCVGGTCQRCPFGQAVCSGACVNISSDPNNCGACGKSCASGLICSSGTCCPPGTTPCGATCANLQSDANNCGTCGQSCPTGSICCSGTCANLKTDPNHCGACGTVCDGKGCVGGRCCTATGRTCEVGKECCSGRCNGTHCA